MCAAAAWRLTRTPLTSVGVNPVDVNPSVLQRILRYDVPASLVVFLVALPLSLGIAMASDAPPLAGLIAAIVGGVEMAVSAPTVGELGRGTRGLAPEKLEQGRDRS